MPVRNFWFDAAVDGRKTQVASGPRSKDGGFGMDLYIRNEGSIECIGRISGYSDLSSGELFLTVKIGDNPIIRVKRKR